jgi:hypothetical protein
MLKELTDSVIETIKDAAGKLTGCRRRQFQAEVATKYCGGSPRRAERLFGWGREAVSTGLGELRTGIRCCDNVTARGRRRTEEQSPQLAEAIHALVEPTSQADPKFQTPFAYTRITARAVREQLQAQASSGADLPVPAQRTLQSILNRLGYRLRRVRKTEPQKKFLRRTPFSSICSKSMPRPPETKQRSACRSTPKPR